MHLAGIGGSIYTQDSRPDALCNVAGAVSCLSAGAAAALSLTPLPNSVRRIAIKVLIMKKKMISSSAPIGG